MTATYQVVRAFKATSPISGSERQFETGDTPVCDAGQHTSTLTFEFKQAFFLVDAATFKNCCTWMNKGASQFLVLKDYGVAKGRR